jgi:hypothetical protein
MYQTILPLSLFINATFFIFLIYLLKKHQEEKKSFHEILDRTQDQLRLCGQDLEEMKKKFDKRPNSRELDEFLMDMSGSGKSVLEVTRIDPSNLFIWNR